MHCMVLHVGDVYMIMWLLIVPRLHQIFSYQVFYTCYLKADQFLMLLNLDFVLCFSMPILFPAICLSTCIAFSSVIPLQFPWLKPAVKQALARKLLELLDLEYLPVIIKLILIQQVLLLLCFC